MASEELLRPRRIGFLGFVVIVVLVIVLLVICSGLPRRTAPKDSPLVQQAEERNEEAGPPPSPSDPQPVPPVAKRKDPPTPVKPLLTFPPRPVSASLDGISVTALSLKSVDEYGKLKPANGEKLLILDLEIVNVAGKTVRYGPRLCKLTDVDGRDVPSSLKDYTNRLGSDDLAKGEKARGVLAFFVTSTKGLSLHYKPSGWKETIVLSLTK